MKKILLPILFGVVAVAGVGTATTLTGCDNQFTRTFGKIFNDSNVVYQASTRFLYSQDGGTSWSETIQEIPINKTYYLAIEMQVAQTEETSEEKTVKATITIPSTSVLDCYLDDHPGVSITGNVDAVTNSVSYDFDVVAGTSPSKFRVVFECKPLEEGRATVEVVYDDNVSESWDSSGTIKYVVADTDNEIEVEEMTADEGVADSVKEGAN